MIRESKKINKSKYYEINANINTSIIALYAFCKIYLTCVFRSIG